MTERTADGSVGGRAVLRSAAFRWFASAQLVSSIGDAFRRMAVLLAMYELSGHSGVAVASLIGAELLPAIALGPIAGAVVDRRSQRALLVAADISRGVVSLALIPAVIWGAPELIYPLVAAASAISTFALPAQYALLPRVVSRTELQGANALLILANQAALVLGPPLAVVMYYSVGAGAALGIDAASFALSATALSTMQWRRPVVGIGLQPTGRALSIWSDAVAGLRYVLRTPLLTAGALTIGAISVSAGLNGTAMIFFISSDLGRDPGDVAWLSSTNGIAQVATGFVIASFAARLRPERLLLVGGVAMAVGGVVCAVSTSISLLLAGVVLVALGNGSFNIASASVEQTYVATEYLGRARSTLELLGTILTVAAAGAAGYSVAWLGARGVLTISAAALLVVALATLTLLVPILRQLRSAAATI